MATLKQVNVVSKLTPQARRRLAQRQKEAFDKARALGHRYFYFNGDWYNTRKAGESAKQWAQNFKDNTTGAGSSRVQTNVGGYFKGKKGKYGRYDDNGNFIEFKNSSNSGSIELKGNNHSNARGWIDADIPTDKIVRGTGTDRGQSSTNTRTGVTIGKKPKLVPVQKDNRISRVPVKNWDAADFIDLMMPSTLIGNAVNAGINGLTGGKYHPFISKSGLNPIGFGKDLVTGNGLGIAERAIDAYTTFGMPGAGRAIDKLGTAAAPTMNQLSSKSAYIPKAITNGTDYLPHWHMNSLSGSKAPVEFGRRSIEKAMNQGVNLPKYARTYANKAVQNSNTGTTYLFRSPNKKYL